MATISNFNDAAAQLLSWTGYTSLRAEIQFFLQESQKKLGKLEETEVHDGFLDLSSHVHRPLSPELGKFHDT